MGWTAPADWSVGEVVVATKMNAHIRDNLKYLKGQAGTIAFESSATFAGRVLSSNSPNVTTGDMKLEGAYSVVEDYHQIAWGPSGLEVSAIRGVAPAGGQMAFDFVLQDASSTTVATGRNVMRMRGDGFIGIGTTTPQGRIHAQGSNGRCLFWENGSNITSAVTVIPDGAGDVLYRLSFIYVTRASDGTTAGGITHMTGTGTSTIGNSSTDTFSLRWNANGSVEVLRTVGSTHSLNQCALWLLWI